MIKVFYIEPTYHSRRYLRRYADGKCDIRPGDFSMHDAKVYIGEGPLNEASGDHFSHEDPRWPSNCSCGYAFQDTDEWQLFCPTAYRRVDNGKEMTLNDAPVGACWNALWYVERKVSGFHVGEDGRCLVVKTPGGEWVIDSRASNCTMKDDNVHQCWVRHGSPELGTLHVDKNGHTCAAGAGSVICGNYHGFLREGYLTFC